jgi:hypothetical protein
MWLRASLKVATKSHPGRLWQDHYQRFCALTYFPSSAELKPFQMDLPMFRDKSKADGLDTMANNARAKLRVALDNMRINANNCALAQFQSREAINCQQIIKLLSESAPPSQEQTVLLECLEQNLSGATVSSWASHTLSFFLADSAAREAFQAVHDIRKHALLVLFGKSCPRSIRDRLIPLPIQPGWLCGPSFQAEINVMAKAQSSLGSLSAAVVQLGGASIQTKSTPKVSGFKPPQAPKLPQKPKARPQNPQWQSGWQMPQVPAKPKKQRARPDYKSQTQV